MKKELAESLRHMQSHPTTGTPHNQQVISTQVETIFAIDTLTTEIKELSKKIDKANKQNEKLEKSNYNLQIAMFILTAIATAVAISPIIGGIIKYIISLVSKTSPTVLVSIITTLVSVVVGFFASFVAQSTLSHRKKILEEKVKLKDRIDILLKDSKGGVKKRLSK